MSAPLVRRPVRDAEPEDTKGRAGCLLLGGALGIIAGALFAFFGLPPLLHHFFGETDVAAGSIYSAGGKTIRIASVVAIGGEGYEVHLEVKSEAAWEPAPDDFQIELGGQSVRITAEPASPSVPDTSLAFPPGSDRPLILRFPVLQGGAEPSVLHIRQPRIRFLLPPAGQ